MASDSYAVVSDPVEEQDPVAIGIFRADLPTSEKRSILCGHVEILAACPGDGEGSVGFADEVRSQLAANGMEERRAGQPSGHSRQERREEQQNQSDAKETATHGCLCRIMRFQKAGLPKRRRKLTRREAYHDIYRGQEGGRLVGEFEF